LFFVSQKAYLLAKVVGKAGNGKCRHLFGEIQQIFRKKGLDFMKNMMYNVEN